ncbi:MAG TPA: head GIN domain-containing protein [Thermoleophilia bacterium]|nr:head GIN domain-containing protein [Thermoleophilia bacterium]
MRGGVLAAVIVVAVVAFVGAAWFGLGYGLTRATGPVVSEDRNVPAFTQVDVSGKGSLIITQGDTPSLRIEAQQGVLDRLETSVSGDTLRIEPRSHWFGFGAFRGSEPITYHLTVPDLEGLKLSGSVAVKGEGSFDAAEFVIECSGSSDVNLYVRADKVQVNSSGSSDITLAGRVDTVVFDSSGSTNIFARGLASRIATVNCSGSSDIELSASEQLNVDASGSSTVSYVGNPVLNTNISGSGEVRQLSP